MLGSAENVWFGGAGRPPGIGCPTWASACSSPAPGVESAHSVAQMAGRPARLCGDDITSLPLSLPPGFCQRGGGARRAALHSINPIHRSPPRVRRYPPRPTGTPGPPEGAPDRWWCRRQRAEVARRCAQDGVDLGDQRGYRRVVNDQRHSGLLGWRLDDFAR